VSRQQAQKKICWDFVHALLELAVSSLALQAGEDRAIAIAAGSKADLKSGCRPLAPSGLKNGLSPPGTNRIANRVPGATCRCQ
jgi:hypothetical protein